MPKSITHVRRLAECEIPLQAFLEEIAGLGERLGCVLVQLPPSLAFEAVRAQSFFATLRTLYSGPLGLEPRHVSWSDEGAEQLMERFQIARVLADPVILPGGEPGGWKGLIYLRLHGSPVVYSSAYATDVLQQAAGTIENYRQLGADVWCIFDNTARGAATANALELIELVQP